MRSTDRQSFRPDVDHTPDTVALLHRAADALDTGQAAGIHAAVARPLAALMRAEAAGLHAALGVPALLDAAAGQPTGTGLRVSYSTLPELTAVARAVLAEPTREDS